MGIGQAAEFGQVDESFAPELAMVPADLTGLASAPEGKYFVWGSFHRVGEARWIDLARINADGTLDETFDAGLSAISSISKLDVQADGAVLALGNLYLADGTVLPKVVRFLPDGTRDESFQLPENIGHITGFTLIPESQKILLNGLLLPTNNVGSTVLLRLEPDGSIDASFTSAVKRGTFTLIQPLTEGKLLVEGWISLSSEPEPYSGPRLRIIREQTNSPPPWEWLPTTPVHQAVRDTNYSIINGNFRSTNTATTFTLSTVSSPYGRMNRLWRLNADGSLDDTFSETAIPDISVTPGPQGVMYAGQTSRDDATGITLERFLADGEKDTTFTPVFESGMRLQSVLPLNTGKILTFTERTNEFDSVETVIWRLANDGSLEAEHIIPLEFTTYPWDKAVQTTDNNIMLVHRPLYSSEPPWILKLQPDGTPEVRFGVPIWGVAGTIPLPQRDGKIYLQHSKLNAKGRKHTSLSRLKKDGSTDETFSPPLVEIYSTVPPVVLPDGDIIANIAPIDDYASAAALVRLNPAGEILYGLTNAWLMRGTRNWAAFPDGSVALARRYTIDSTEDDPYLRFFTSSFETRSELHEPPEADDFGDQDLKITPEGKLLALEMNYFSTEESFYIEYHVKRFSAAGELEISYNILPDLTSFYSLEVVADSTGYVYAHRPTPGGFGSSRGSAVPDNDLPQQPSSQPLQRYLVDGRFDISFNTQLTTNSTVDHVWPQKDGRVLIAGRFFSSDGRKVSTLARLRADGSLDESFVPPAGEVVPIYRIAVEVDGNVLVGGAFDRIGGVERPGLARLKSIEQPQMRNVTFTEGGLSVQLDGNAGRTWLIQASDDLAGWITVATITTGSETETVELPAPGSGNKFYRAVLAP